MWCKVEKYGYFNREQITHMGQPLFEKHWYGNYYLVIDCMYYEISFFTSVGLCTLGNTEVKTFYSRCYFLYICYVAAFATQILRHSIIINSTGFHSVKVSQDHRLPTLFCRTLHTIGHTYRTIFTRQQVTNKLPDALLHLSSVKHVLCEIIRKSWLFLGRQSSMTIN